MLIEKGRSMLRAALRARRWLLVIAAIPLGAVGAAVALVTAVAVTGNRALAAVAGALAVVLVTGGLSWLTARGISLRFTHRS